MQLTSNAIYGVERMNDPDSGFSRKIGKDQPNPVVPTTIFLLKALEIKYYYVNLSCQ
jgi:hypothetical protein